MNLKLLRDISDIAGKTVLLRVAYDVPLYEKNGKWHVADARRIAETLPTIKFLQKHKCKIVLLSWLKRPNGIEERYRLDPVAATLSKLMKKKVKKINDCIGPARDQAIADLRPGELLLLENVRFYPEEALNKKSFAQLLVQGIDVIVFDAFAQAHRVHASTVGIAGLRPIVAGELFEKEISQLQQLATRPKRPFVVIIGGAKISDKVATLEHLAVKADKILLGGGVANVFMKAQGIPIGASYIEDTFIDQARRKKVDFVKLAQRLLATYPQKFVLPLDYISANEKVEKALTEPIDIAKETIDSRWMFLDIGPKTIEQFKTIIQTAETVFWNGPMGVFELPQFEKGTEALAQTIAQLDAQTVIGGGDTERVVQRYGLEGQFSHVSTGGGATMEYLSGKVLPIMPFLLNKK